MDAERARIRTERIQKLWNDEGPEAMVREVWSPDIVLDEGVAFPDSVRVEGAEAAAARLRDRGAHMGAMRLELEDVEVVDEHLTLSRYRVHIEGQGSGVAIDFPWWFLTTFDEADERVTELREFRTEEAVHAALAGS